MYTSSHAQASASLEAAKWTRTTSNLPNGTEWRRFEILASRPDNFYRYGLAALAAVAALLLRKLLMPVLGEQNPYHTAWAAVVFSAWYCGLGPSIVTVLLEVIGIWYWFLLPSPSIQLANPRAENSGMLGFLAFSGFIIR